MWEHPHSRAVVEHQFVNSPGTTDRGQALPFSPLPFPSAAALPARVRRQVRESCKKPLADARFGMKLPVAVRLGRLRGRF